ncbi:uncharacterized protein EI90DRAFT_3257470 [Cantharellus anzutake]|uniref:uncharacterized protein n=1 Tax=Cantharellus anzutake TaxID=1750568 RepID=UPI001903DFE9|nr:uncharacterized protein EI90DRAFT_3257470 [Cantharellus anzutake]KAF8318591.1 hypothetical protein EI90DRAFT_3257470 [Cantharellus anzutake]
MAKATAHRVKSTDRLKKEASGTPSLGKMSSSRMHNYRPYPPIESIKPVLSAVNRLGLFIFAAIGFAWSFSAFGKGRKIEKEIKRIRSDLHRVRGETVHRFISLADMVEDVIRLHFLTSWYTLIPDAVKISDFGQNTNLIPIVGRVLFLTGDRREERID